MYGVDPPKQAALDAIIAQNQRAQANAMSQMGPSLMNGPDMLRQAKQQQIDATRGAQQAGGFLSPETRMQVLNSPSAIKVPVSGARGLGGPNPIGTGAGATSLPGDVLAQYRNRLGAPPQGQNPLIAAIQGQQQSPNIQQLLSGMNADFTPG